MLDIFDHPAPKDRVYHVIRDHPDSAAYVRHLWQLAEPFLQAGKRHELANQFHATFWELYLAASLSSLGIRLTAAVDRRTRQGGPDLQIGNGEVWVEAVLATSGEGEDALGPWESYADGTMRNIPDEQILLRISSAVRAKAKKYGDYVRKRYIQPAEAFVIAVNGCGIPYARVDNYVPRIVRALFGIGELVVTFDIDSQRVTSEHSLPMPAIVKRNGASVPMTSFLNPCSSFISGVLWGTADVSAAALHPEPLQLLGRDLLFIHNPVARVPLPHGWIRTGREYWYESQESQLHCRDWGRTSDTKTPDGAG